MYDHSSPFESPLTEIGPSTTVNTGGKASNGKDSSRRWSRGRKRVLVRKVQGEVSLTSEAKHVVGVTTQENASEWRKSSPLVQSCSHINPNSKSFAERDRYIDYSFNNSDHPPEISVRFANTPSTLQTAGEEKKSDARISYHVHSDVQCFHNHATGTRTMRALSPLVTPFPSSQTTSADMTSSGIKGDPAPPSASRFELTRERIKSSLAKRVGPGHRPIPARRRHERLNAMTPPKLGAMLRHRMRYRDELYQHHLFFCSKRSEVRLSYSVHDHAHDPIIDLNYNLTLISILTLGTGRRRNGRFQPPPRGCRYRGMPSNSGLRCGGRMHQGSKTNSNIFNTPSPTLTQIPNLNPNPNPIPNPNPNPNPS